MLDTRAGHENEVTTSSPPRGGVSLLRGWRGQVGGSWLPWLQGGPPRGLLRGCGRTHSSPYMLAFLGAGRARTAGREGAESQPPDEWLRLSRAPRLPGVQRGSKEEEKRSQRGAGHPPWSRHAWWQLLSPPSRHLCTPELRVEP